MTSPNRIVGDPLRAYEPLPLRQTFYPLGFPVEIETNHPAVHEAAACSWPTQHPIESVQPLQVRIGVTESASQLCPPSPVARAHFHLISIVADQENFAQVDLQAGFAFGWISTAALHHESYFRYCLLEAVIMTLLSAKHVTPVHAACVGFGGRSLLLTGQSGAGKSTLAYACARSGWTYTSDDSCYLPRDRDTFSVRGNARQFRFRPEARQLFPELAGYAITPRLVGKPSIEIPSSEFPHIVTRSETRVDAMVLLSRHSSPNVELLPLATEDAMNMLQESIFPLPYVCELQQPALQRLLRVPAFVLRYRDLTPAIERLQELVHELAP